MIEKSELINDFTLQTVKGNAAFFVGAGLSVPYGLPDFKGLICELSSNKIIDLSIDDKHNLPEIAQYILNAYGGDKKTIIQKIQNRFYIPYEKTKSTYYSAIGMSNVKTIWTTNYDTLIERAIQDSGKNYTCKNCDSQFQSEFENTDNVEVLKMHGDIESDDVIITKKDYEDFTLTHRLTIRRFEKDLMTKSILFVGYSYKDPNIQSIVNHVRQLTDGKLKFKHYLIVEAENDENDQKLQQLWIEDLKRYNISTYVLKNGFKELEEILSEISRKSKGKSVFVTGSHSVKDSIMAENLGHELAKIRGLVLNYGQSEGGWKNRKQRICPKMSK